MSTKKKKAEVDLNVIAHNKRARFDYYLETSFEAGLVLEGWEVKSLRAGKVQLVGSFVAEKRGELFLLGAQISPLASASSHVDPNPDRPRKLLLHRREVNQVIAGLGQKQQTCVCVRLYWKAGKVKANIAMARGKKKYDKRATSRDRDWARTQRRLVKNAAR